MKMEVVHHQTPSEVSPQVEGEDLISSMPDNVIADIMDRLSLRDGVRTSILSRRWRFKWTLLTQLFFDVDFLDTLHERKIHFDKSNISRLLLHLKGPVTIFVLCIKNNINVDDEDVHHWVMFLSRITGFKALVLLNWRETLLKLPTHVSACLELNYLKLFQCVLFPSPCFCGFPKLLTLELLNVTFQDHRCGEVIAQCPLLVTLRIGHTKHRGGIKLDEIAKLENLKILGFSLCLLDDINNVRLSTVFPRLSLLPKLQELKLNFRLCEHMSLLPKLLQLDLSFENCKFLPDDVAQSPVSITFPFLKTLTLFEMDFSSDSMLSCAFRMLFGSANLQTLEIIAVYENAAHPPTIISPEVDCSTMGQLQLRNVKLDYIKGLENEVCLIKFLLAFSPVLKSMVINWSIKNNDGNENYKLKYKLASKLLKLHRASPMAEIIF